MTFRSKPMTKTKLIERARQNLSDVRQYFIDIAHHNLTTMPEDYVDPDPDGSVLQMAHGLERFIHAHEQVIDV